MNHAVSTPPTPPPASFWQHPSATPAKVDHLCRRVTTSDLGKVTDADVQDVLRNATPQQIREAIRVMVETNRYGDVVANAPSTVFDTTLGAVTEPMMVEARGRVKSSPQTQGSILATLTDHMRSLCGNTLRRVYPTQYADGTSAAASAPRPATQPPV